jgi:hypothetical protein
MPTDNDIKALFDLPDDVRDWPADALDAYRERVAIMVVDGGLEQRRAMHEAEARVRLEWARREPVTPPDDEERG